MPPIKPPTTVDETLSLLAAGNYVADRSLATALFLALSLRRPLFLEGEAGVGKTEVAKSFATAIGARLIRLHETLYARDATIVGWSFVDVEDRFIRLEVFRGH